MCLHSESSPNGALVWGWFDRGGVMKACETKNFRSGEGRGPGSWNAKVVDL